MSADSSSAAGDALGAYGGRVRVRVGALLFDADRTSVLLAEHGGIWDDLPFWTPPGGGVDFGESLPDALGREVQEETGLDVEAGPLRYTLDFVRPPLHAVSFYFEARLSRGRLSDAALGRDPELGDAQLLRALRLVPLADLGSVRVYPEAFGARLRSDVDGGFSEGLVYLGTAR